MKKLFFVAVVAIVAACAPKNTGEWTLRGKIKGLGDGVARLYIVDDIMHPGKEETVEIKNGRIDYRGTVDRPMIGSLSLPGADGKASDRLGEFIAEPGARLKIEGDVSWPQPTKGYVGGNRTNDRLSALYKEMERMIALDQMDEFPQTIFEFVGENTDNFGGVLMLSQMSLTGRGNIVPTEEVMALYPKFTPEMKALPVMVEIGKRIDEAKAKEAAFGGKYIEIVSTTPDGKQLKLSDVVAANRYTLIDFWASWCGPCLREMPYLREAYAKFHGQGFEIFGVSLDADGEAWRKATVDHDMTWLHVNSIEDGDDSAAAAYGVRSIPASWLVDGEGNIVARNLRGEAVAEKLAELFQ